MEFWQRAGTSRSLGGSIQFIDDEERDKRAFRNGCPCAVIGFNRADHDRIAQADKRRLAKLSAHGELAGVTPRVTVEATATCRTCQTETDLLAYVRNGGWPVLDCAGDDARTI